MTDDNPRTEDAARHPHPDPGRGTQGGQRNRRPQARPSRRPISNPCSRAMSCSLPARATRPIRSSATTKHHFSDYEVVAEAIKGQPVI